MCCAVPSSGLTTSSVIFLLASSRCSLIASPNVWSASRPALSVLRHQTVARYDMASDAYTDSLVTGGSLVNTPALFSSFSARQYKVLLPWSGLAEVVQVLGIRLLGSGALLEVA
jgi:hypothetical protein